MLFGANKLRGPIVTLATCAVNAEDRKTYFGVLDAFDREGDLASFRQFLQIQTLKSILAG